MLSELLKWPPSAFKHGLKYVYKFSGTFWSSFSETEAITHVISLCKASGWVLLWDLPTLPFFSCQLFEEEIQYTYWSQVGLLKKYRGNDSPRTYSTLHLYIYNEMVHVEWHEDFDPSILDILRTNMTIKTKPCLINFQQQLWVYDPSCQYCSNKL
jgi:hypothetical protein